MSSKNTRRIAKNTGFLYIRMLLMMGVAFYTSRVVLNVLGVEDFGIYNVVGGVVAMFSFLTGTFTNCTQRFLNYEMGLGNEAQLRNIFSMSITLNGLIAILVVVISEIVGIWFINHKLVIPPNRLVAAHWVFQFSLLATIVTIVSTPYNALIIAHERMKIFAWISILEGILKLAVAVIILWGGGDKLIIYSFLILSVAIIIRSVYSIYCKKVFPEYRYRFFWDKILFKEMGGYAGWNLYGNFAFVMITQGLNILLNMFFGPVVNASRAIAVQVQSAVEGFATNFMMASTPRITQDYAQGKREEMLNLVFGVTKFSFFLMLLLIAPVIIDTASVLKIWLGQVPEYSVVFMRLILLQMLVKILQAPLHTLIYATGRMRKYQLIDGTLLLLNIPVSYFLLQVGADAPIVFEVSLGIVFLELLAMLYVLATLMDFPVGRYMREILYLVFQVFIIVSVLSYIFFLLSEGVSFYWRFILRVSGMFVMTIGIIWRVGLSKKERGMIKEYISVIFSKYIFPGEKNK